MLKVSRPKRVTEKPDSPHAGGIRKLPCKVVFAQNRAGPIQSSKTRFQPGLSPPRQKMLSTRGVGHRVEALSTCKKKNLAGIWPSRTGLAQLWCRRIDSTQVNVWQEVPNVGHPDGLLVLS